MFVKDKLIIVFPFFDEQVEELLYQATQTNIFEPGQVVEYHVFGNTESFQRSHRNLEQLHIIFHEENAFDCILLLQKADRIILCNHDGSLKSISTLIEIVRRGRIDIISKTELSVEMLIDTRSGRISSEQLEVHVYNWLEKVCNEESVFRDERILVAQMFNKHYVDEYNHEQSDKVEKLWSRIDTFERYSNIAAVDYHYVQRLLLYRWYFGTDGRISLDDMDNSTDFAKLENELCEILERYNEASGELKQTADKLAELEHIRWCNYHFYNNWTFKADDYYTDPLKGKEAREHKDLRPYSELPEKEKDKDRRQIKYLFEAYAQKRTNA